MKKKREKITKFPVLEPKENRGLYRKMKKDFAIDMGWGRLIFANTFSRAGKLAKALCTEKEGQSDIVVYSRYPNITISKAPHEIFLSPSYFYRLWLDEYKPRKQLHSFKVSRISKRADAKGIVKMLAARHFIQPSAKFIWDRKGSRGISYVVAKDKKTGQVIGAVQGIDHKILFNDAENGASFWQLAVDPQASEPGIGLALVEYLAEQYKKSGRSYIDLSVMADSKDAIKLYKKMGFKRIYTFVLKHKNPFNERLFSAPAPKAKVTHNAKIIINEAKRRGIVVEVLNAKNGYFSLSFGGRKLVCRESLSELTNAASVSICQNKEVALMFFKRAELKVPVCIVAGSEEKNRSFLTKYKRVVVKPSFGEAGKGIFVDIKKHGELEKAIKAAGKVSGKVLIEELVEGKDLTVIVIDSKVVFAALVKPPRVKGNGKNTVRELIGKYNRRRMAATGGESSVPLDSGTKRCIKASGYTLKSVLPKGKSLRVREGASIHTGATMHDVTSRLGLELARVAVKAANAIDIPVAALDFIAPRLNGREYAIIEANEMPSLAIPEPRHVAEKFIDLLFPQTVASNKI